jgi:hypothetical protein
MEDLKMYQTVKVNMPLPEGSSIFEGLIVDIENKYISPTDHFISHYTLDFYDPQFPHEPPIRARLGVRDLESILIKEHNLLKEIYG